MSKRKRWRYRQKTYLIGVRLFVVRSTIGIDIVVSSGVIAIVVVVNGPR